MRNGMIMTGLTMVCAAALAGCGQVQPESAHLSAPVDDGGVEQAALFEVDEQFKGPKVGSRIEVLTFDLDRIQIADEEPVKLGAEVVLFLGRERNGVWARAAGDQAVLDVQSDGALRAHRAADPALAQQARKTQKAELEALVQAP